MKLSMEILADKLKKYTPEINITAGGLEITGARLLSTAGDIRRDIVYIAPARDYIDDPTLDGSVLCVHGADWIKLNTNDANGALSSILDIFDEFNAWEAGLREAAEEGRSMQHLIEISGYALPFPIFITDTLGNIVAFTKEYGVNEVDIFWDSIAGQGRLHDKIFSGSVTDSQNRTVYDWDITPGIYNTPQRRIIGLHLIQSGETIGAITIVEHETKLSAGVCQLAGIFRDAASAALYKSGMNAQLRTVSSLVRDYLDGKSVDTDYLWSHISSHTGQGKDELEIILIRNIRRADFNFKSNLAYRLASATDECYCMVYRDYVMVVITCGNEKSFLTNMRKQLSDIEYVCGVSLPFASIEAMPSALTQARLAIKTGDRTQGAVNKCVDYAYMYLLNRLSGDDGIAAGLLHPALKQLKNYDKDRGTSLYETLYEYLRLERNVVATAKHLFIHRNSMIYRLQRLNKLLNLDLDNLNVRMYLLLSFHIDMARDGTTIELFAEGVRNNGQ